MSRPFVNLLVNKLGGNRPPFSLHRIDPASLFRRRTRSPKPAAAPTKKAPPSTRLPPAAVSLDWPRTWNRAGSIDFMALNNDVVAVDHAGHTLLYDGALGAVCAMNRMVDPRRSSISLNVGGGLYAMDVNPGRPPKVAYFNAFTYGPSFGGCLPEDWYWRPLPPPPLDYDRYEHDPSSPAHPCAIGAYAVVRDSEIWVSTAGAGTYAFDTASRAWSKVGEWALPFRGHARHVPELALWFGFSESDGQLCAADLALASPPVKQNSWEEPPVPEGWIPKASDLLPLGSGRLCVVRLFKVVKRGRPRPPFYGDVTVLDSVVLTGVEVREAGPGSLRMIKHRSKRYRFGDYDDVKLV